MTTAPKCQAKDPNACVDPNCPEKVWRASQLSSAAGLDNALDSLDKKAAKTVVKEKPAHIQEAIDIFAARLDDLSLKDAGLTVSDLEYLYDEMRGWHNTDNAWDDAADLYGDELDALENSEKYAEARRRATIGDYYYEAYENGGEEKARKWTAQKYGQEFWQILKEREDWEESVINYNSY